MAERKFYWLKLKEGFFHQKEIKKLRRIAGGDTYTIIYLKMQLKSLSDNGSLFFENFEDSFVEELAMEIDESPDNVRVTLLYLEKHGLIEKVDNEQVEEFRLPAVKENTGSETNKAAAMRRLRQRRKEVTMLPDVTESYNLLPEIEIEKEKEIELDKEREKDIDSNVGQMSGQMSIKDRDRVREKKKSPTRIFKKPLKDEIGEYIRENNFAIDAETFFDYYESKDWYVGKNKMKDWKAALRNWNRRQKEFNTGGKQEDHSEIIRRLCNG